MLIDIVFDGPPGPKPGNFVEVENTKGEGINAGEWIDRGNGLWALRLEVVGNGQVHATPDVPSDSSPEDAQLGRERDELIRDEGRVEQRETVKELQERVGDLTFAVNAARKALNDA